MKILECEHLTKRFGGLVAVDDVSFYINEGEILGLIGPNGSGKTTLFNLITGTYHGSPMNGTIKFYGREISREKPHNICKMGISRTFQLIKPFLNKTALQNVLVGIYFGRRDKVSEDAALPEAQNILDFVGLEKDKHNEIVANLPIIDRKRVEIARALGTKPKLLLLDEPMSGMNVQEITQFSDLICQIRDSKITVFMIEHVMRAIMDLSDRVIVLNYGKKIAEGHPKEITSNKKVVEAYLGEAEW